MSPSSFVFFHPGNHTAETTPPELLRLLAPASALADWAILGAATFAGLADFGINVRPILASLGASSVVVGFAAQGPLRNAVAAVVLWSSRLFIPGDHVQLLSGGGGVVVEGTIESVQVWRTIVRTREGVPVFVSNADVLNTYLVKYAAG